MKPGWLWLCCLIILSASCTSTKKLNYKLTSQKHNPEDLKKDLRILKNALEEAHPGLYWYVSKKEVDSVFSSVDNRINTPLTSAEFYRLAAPAVTMLRDGHTRLILPGIKKSEKEKETDKKKGKAPLSQFNFKIIDNKLFIIVNNSSDSTLIKGSEIERIDGKPLKEVVSNIESLFSSDGFNETFKSRYTEKQFSGLYKTYYNKSDSILLTINGKNHLITYFKKPVDSVALKDKKLQNKLRKEREKRRYKGFGENDEPLLDLQIIPGSVRTGVLRVRSFSFPGDDHKKFFEEAFEEVKNKGIEKLILDLRYNPGGKLSACKTLFSYLISKESAFLSDLEVRDKWYPSRKYFDNKLILNIQNAFIVKRSGFGYRARLKGIKPVTPAKLHYTGDLYVLINGYSFSASSLLAANLYGIKRGIFIGEETGGGYNKCTAGIIPLVTLPETRVKLRLPLIKIAPAKTRDLEGWGVLPDYHVMPELNDLLNKKDTELNFTLKLITEGNNIKSK